MTKHNSFLLLVEDDRELAQMMQAFFEEEGFHLEWIGNGPDAVTRLHRNPPPDLVILDVLLPGLNGVEVCRQVRTHYTQPILMLTAKNDDLTEINSLNRGADGYLTKPVRPHVLMAHVKSLLRRGSTLDDSLAGEQRLVVQDIELYPDSLVARVNGHALALSTAEFQLLSYFMRHVGEMVTRDALYQTLRGIDYDGLDRSIDMRVSTLRKKLNDAIPPFRYIKTVRGKGYLLALN